MTSPFGPDSDRRSDRRYRLLLGTAALVIIAAGIREAAGVLNSILLAMLLTLTVVPAFDALRRRGVSKALAVVITSALLAGVLLAMLGVLGLSGTRLLQVLPHYQDRAESLRQGIEGMLAQRGIEPERVMSLDLVDPNRLLGLAAGFLSGLGKVLSQALLLILIVAFFLAERGVSDQTFRPDGTAGRVARDVRQYLLLTALTGLGFSVLVWLVMLVVGTDLALVWAVLAFIMNFVPNVGIILSVIPPVILTLLELGWQRAVVILAAFLVLNFVVDNLIKPRVMQRGLDVPPIMALLSLMVWAYLLGPIGTLLAVPLTIALRRVLQDADLAVPGLAAPSGPRG
ncbi:MAG TPA: AI-2E family transporter [Gemmatimonadales bacterium]|nr:AI-2E family transporter [Gemmatimonadales bacterium]